MRSKEKVPLKISVMPSTSTRQFNIQSNFNRATGDWDDIYIDISGYFGKFSPHTFAAAPEMLDILDIVSALDIDPRVLRRIDDLRAKARGAA
ncbi:hypothetical protein OIV19_20355 [Brucella sp. HL-2]|nr:hypothetical protein [Brucella sp. HL-2]MCV9909954.1 hypothetical protein [Brucella sp. HL-2]